MPYFVKPIEVNQLTHHAVCCDEICSGAVLVDFPSQRKSQGFKTFLEKQPLPAGDVAALITFLKSREPMLKDCQWAKACEQARKNLEALQ